MIFNAHTSHQHSKGITQTFYTVFIALISIVFLILILVLFIQKFFDIQLTIKDTEQDRSVINLAQVLMSSNKLVYVDSDGVVHRGVIDAGKARNINMDELRTRYSYTGFYYTLSITDLDKNTELTHPVSVAESLKLFANYVSTQTRNYPVAIRYDDGTIDAGAMSIKTGFASSTVTTSIPPEGVG